MRKRKYPFITVRPLLEFINEFEKPKIGEFVFKRGSLVNDIKDVAIKREKNNFQVEFNVNKYFSNGGQFDLNSSIRNIHLQIGDDKIHIDEIFLTSIAPPVAKGKISVLASERFTQKKQYFQCVIPTSKHIKFHFTIQEHIYSSEYFICSRNAISVDIQEDFFEIVSMRDKVNEKSYLIFKSNLKQSFEVFSEKVFAIRVALGYTIGHFAGNQAYFFAFSNKEMKDFKSFQFRYLRDEIRSLSSPINSNPHAWIRIREIADKYSSKKELRPLSKIEFSNFTDLVFNNDDFLALVLLIIESSNASLLIRSSGYAIALEALADIVIGKLKANLSPITSKSESKKFRLELYKVLDIFKDNENFKDIKTIKGRLDNINQLTNKERLRSPFRILKINLSPEDIAVIESRNDFLHGRIPDFRQLGESRSIEEKDRDLYYASSRFYTLLSKLILKYIGYDNYVLNFVQIHNRGYLVNQEDYYLKV